MSGANESFRTLVRCEAKSDNGYSVVIPGWDVHQLVRVPVGSIPFELEVGQRVHARVNIGAEKATELVFRDWEEE